MTTELIQRFKQSIHSVLSQPNAEPSTLEKAFNDELQYSPEVKKVFLDQSFRSFLAEEILNVPPINLQSCKALINLSIKAAQNDVCSAAVPINLLGDVFDVITLDQCEGLFSFVEDSVSLWKEKVFFDTIKNSLLRVCNDLLRRLSRSQNTVFCGRILLFLARFFPFSERSGLNVISEFNLENYTVFSNDDMNGSAAPAEEIQEMEIDENESTPAKKIKLEADQKNLNIDYALYAKFWQLQDYFRNPVQCYNKENWTKFTEFSDDVLKTFHSFKIDNITAKRSANKEDDRFFAKYLTNQNLLQLQMSDSNFRRYIYVQMLILYQYLQSPVKFKQDSFVLNDEQTKWMNASRAKIFQLMKETPPKGEAFARSVEHLLNREEQWNSWKNEGCPALRNLKPEPASKKDEDKKINVAIGIRKRKAKLGDQILEATSVGKFLMGNASLTKLWNICPDNLEACASVDRDFLPSLEEYFTEAIEQLNPVNQVEDAYKKVNDGQWGWRALRLLAKKSPNFFTYGNNPIATLPEYLESMLKKLSNTIKIGGHSVENDAKHENGKDQKKPEDESIVCTSEHLEKLAENLTKFEKWNKLIPKLGLEEKELEKIFEEKKIKDTKDKILTVLKKWSDFEGTGATNEEIIYILEGIKMKEAAAGVFPE